VDRNRTVLRLLVRNDLDTAARRQLCEKRPLLDAMQFALWGKNNKTPPNNQNLTSIAAHILNLGNSYDIMWKKRNWAAVHYACCDETWEAYWLLFC